MGTGRTGFATVCPGAAAGVGVGRAAGWGDACWRAWPPCRVAEASRTAPIINTLLIPNEPLLGPNRGSRRAGGKPLQPKHTPISHRWVLQHVAGRGGVTIDELTNCGIDELTYFLPAIRLSVESAKRRFRLG